MPNALFVLGAGAGFFLAMYQWVTLIADTIRSTSPGTLNETTEGRPGAVDEGRRRRLILSRSVAVGSGAPGGHGEDLPAIASILSARKTNRGTAPASEISGVRFAPD